MNAIAKPWPGGKAGSKQRSQLILLGCLALVLVAVLAWEGPKLLHRSGSSSEPVATSAIATPAAPTAPAVGATAGIAAPSAAAATRTKVWIAHQHARDPFAPLAGAEPAPAPAATPATPAATPATTLAPAAHAATPALATPSVPTVTVASPPATATTPTPVAPAKVKPSIAVVYANGKKHAVSLDQYFKVSDLWFRLKSVDETTIKLALVHAAFSGGRDAITVRRNHRVKLVNNATGVEYSLLFTRGTSGIATNSQTEPTTAPSATASVPTAAAPATTSSNES
jgi:hypothetical protein